VCRIARFLNLDASDCEIGGQGAIGLERLERSTDALLHFGENVHSATSGKPNRCGHLLTPTF
jgi:hypothetical protein